MYVCVCVCELIVLMAKRNYLNLFDSPKLHYNTETNKRVIL